MYPNPSRRLWGGELGILGQKAIAGMDGLGVRGESRFQNRIGAQIGQSGGRGPDADGLVGHLDMQGVLVRIGIDRDGGDAHSARSLDDSAGDFAAIGDQDFLEHAIPVWSGGFCGCF